MQEALLRAWRQRASCRNAGAPLPWLLQITRNEALRLRARRQRQPLPASAEESADANVVDAALERSVERLDVDAALGELDRSERQLLELRYERDLTQLRCAEMLGVPEGTVKVRLHRLRERLRQRLDAAR